MSTGLQERIAVAEGGVSVTEVQEDHRVTLRVGIETDKECVLHWGLSRGASDWRRPPEALWPPGTSAVNAHAANTPLVLADDGKRELSIQVDLPCSWRNLVFVVHFPRENRWLKNNGRDFAVPLPSAGSLPEPETALEAWLQGEEATHRVFQFPGGLKVAVAVQASSESVRVRLVSDAEGPLLLHWGLAPRFSHEWELPPAEFRPAGTALCQQRAAQTAFEERDGLQYLELDFKASEAGPRPRGLKFVLYQPALHCWLNQNGGDFHVPLFASSPDPRIPAGLWGLAERIVGVEMGAPSWTLMHRFNLCHDLVADVKDSEDGLALLYAWLRYSATRQLDWQRSYNTKPRELSHAQDRLTTRLAGLWRSQPHSVEGARRQHWLCLMLTTLGRGGDGQRVRDEILHIMHRHNLKETSGHFIEEWHQKLHNNTTPDDIVICRALLAFLKSNGDVKQFYQTLEAGNVTRERLKSLERPITHDPTFYADKKDALIQEFENFLRILNSVHAGTDLEAAAAAARAHLDAGLNAELGRLLGMRRADGAVNDLMGSLASTRGRIRGVMSKTASDAALRDLLFLDLALEELWRSTVERQNLSRLDRRALQEFTTCALRHVRYSLDDPELEACVGHWAKLVATNPADREGALHAKSVADRAARWLQTFTDAFYQCLQPKAEFLGSAFRAAEWVVKLFSEEVVRGGPTFALSLLLRHLDPQLRQAAGLGGWQVISPAHAAGRVRVVARLHDVQAEQFSAATILITDVVKGDEEIPAGVTAVVTSDTPDLVSHVAVRARNAHLLFATCFDRDVYQRLKDLHDRTVELRVNPAGDVAVAESNEDIQTPHAVEQPLVLSFTPRRTSLWVLGQDQFTPELVGGKSNNLNGLRGKLPDWIRLPTSLALPFGTFEKVLEDKANSTVRQHYSALMEAVERNPAEVLAQLRSAVQQLAAPTELKTSLEEAWPRAGFTPIPWDQAWHAVQQVWASQWNDRAYFSRRRRGIPHDRLQMAVLIQQVIPADYAYVIHTTNPFTGNSQEIYAEVVLGLGETLVGNYPGRALGFICRKDDLRPTVLSFPGKSAGLYGQGVIFRSDSNGEDLEGFAGAGLYDSFLAEEPERRLLDYRDEKLVWDSSFRTDLLSTVARLGLEVERLLGSPQDLEGAVAGGRFYVVQTRPQVGLNAV